MYKIHTFELIATALMGDGLNFPPGPVYIIGH